MGRCRVYSSALRILNQYDERAGFPQEKQTAVRARSSSHPALEAERPGSAPINAPGLANLQRMRPIRFGRTYYDGVTSIWKKVAIRFWKTGVLKKSPRRNTVCERGDHRFPQGCQLTAVGRNWRRQTVLGAMGVPSGDRQPAPKKEPRRSPRRS